MTDREELRALVARIEMQLSWQSDLLDRADRILLEIGARHRQTRLFAETAARVLDAVAPAKKAS